MHTSMHVQQLQRHKAQARSSAGMQDSDARREIEPPFYLYQPLNQLTGVGHDGQEVVPGHLALGVLNLVGALQRLHSKKAGEQGQGW